MLTAQQLTRLAVNIAKSRHRWTRQQGRNSAPTVCIGMTEEKLRTGNYAPAITPAYQTLSCHRPVRFSSFRSGSTKRGACVVTQRIVRGESGPDSVPRFQSHAVWAATMVLSGPGVRRSGSRCAQTAEHRAGQKKETLTEKVTEICMRLPKTRCLWCYAKTLCHI